MIVCLKTRLGEVHIISWTTPGGIHYTLCNKAFSNKANVETFAADNTFRNMCTNCYQEQESANQSAIDTDLREVRPDGVSSLNTSNYLGIQRGWNGTESEYGAMAQRYWPKGKRMRKNFPTNDRKRVRHKKGWKKYMFSLAIGK